MKKLIGTVILTILVSIATAQYRIDSLEKQLASSQPDTNRVLTLSNLSIANLSSNHEKAMKYAQEGIALARVLKFRRGEADCLRRSGIVLFQQGRYPEALDIYQRALSISESINDALRRDCAIILFGVSGRTKKEISGSVQMKE